MAFRAAKNVRLILGGGGRRSFTTATTPKLKPSIDAAAAHHHDPHSATWMRSVHAKAEFAPVYIVCGMVCVAMAIGSHTAYQQLARSPTVHINKKRRETVPEVSDPDRTINSATRFFDGSFLRKLSHIQHNNPTLHHPNPNPFTRPRNAETLKTVGVDPTTP